MDTVSLVNQAKQGDKDALVHLIMYKKQEFYRLAYVYVGNREDALDAMEDMIVILYEKIHKLKKPASFYSWSKTILANRCKHLLQKRKNVVLMDNSVREDLHTGNYDNTDYQIDILHYLSELSPKHQEVIKLRYFLDLDYKTIASIAHIPLGTVKSRIANGLKKLKESMGVNGDVWS